ncbi:MAG: hypothetical protein ACAH83_11825 [Alphaproteobacteria bacterium]
MPEKTFAIITSGVIVFPCSVRHSVDEATEMNVPDGLTFHARVSTATSCKTAKVGDAIATPFTAAGRQT